MNNTGKAINGYNGIKVFSATMNKERERLGETVTDWMSMMSKKGVEVTDTVVTQSSDNEFHCIAITVFYKVAA